MDCEHQEASKSNDEATASKAEDSDSYMQKEIETLKEEMANMTKALAKAK